MQKSNTTREKLKTALQLNRTLAFVWRASPWAALFSAVLVLIQGLFPLAMLYLVKLIVDEADRILSAPGSQGLAWIFALVAIAGGVAILRTVCQQAADYASETLSVKVSDYVYDL
ncbi:MAG TPA: hypothetical protein VKO20_10255, partial [Desulfosalsimonadaceae bacterium]|nr:hypothetical protein [Desulfosalsimonadaceae bacterium]